MDSLREFFVTVSAVALSTIVPIIGYYIRAFAEHAKERTVNLIQQRLGDGAARVAGEIAAAIAGDPSVQAATRSLLEEGVKRLNSRFPDSAGPVADETLMGMIAGELGKLGIAVTSVAELPQDTKVAVPPVPRVRFFGEDG